MSVHPVGTRVLAIRNGDKDTMFVFGVGTYVGKEIPASRDSEITDEDRAGYEMYVRATEENAAKNRNDMVRFWLERDICSAAEAETRRAEMEVADAVDAAKPMDQRIAEFHAAVMGNPKIVLDNGDVIWGYQCWWGPVDQTRAKYGDIPEVVVPVPDGNEHVDDWVPPTN